MNRIALALGVAAPLAAAGILVPFRADWSNTNVALVLVVVVVAVATFGNRLAGALAAASAFAWFDFFFTRPYERFTIHSSADVTTAVLLLLVGLAVSQLAANGRRMRVLATTDARYLDQVHGAAELSRTARSPDTVIDHVIGLLSGLLSLDACRFEYGSLIGHPARLEPDGTVVSAHRSWDVAEFGFPAGDIELRTFCNGEYCGRFMLTPSSKARPTLQARLVAVTLADLAGRAIGAAQNAR
jgi:K+-sensing histidine kinase KdpD